MSSRPGMIAFVLCLVAFMFHAGFTIYCRDIRASWANVPPVPGEQGAVMMTAGDPQLAYRAIGLVIQNLGDIGGRSMPLSAYNYDRLGQWFVLTDKLDNKSDFVPLLAAFYFSATQKPETLGPIVDYLAMIGQRPDGEKWRWLAQAVYLARFRMEDLGKAMDLAGKLAVMRVPDMPAWTRQMPAFIADAQGDKEAAYGIIMAILRDESANLHPAEVNFMVGYICERLLDETQAAQHPLCIAQE